MQTEILEAARTEVQSEAGAYSRKRRRHVMEGSFADAFNNHGAKKARWRGLARQRIQSWLIATVQNLRVLVRNLRNRPAAAAEQTTILSLAAAQVLKISKNLNLAAKRLRRSLPIAGIPLLAFLKSAAAVLAGWGSVFENLALGQHALTSAPTIS